MTEPKKRPSLLSKFFKLFVYKEPTAPDTFVLPEFKDENVETHDNEINATFMENIQNVKNESSKKKNIKKPLNVSDWNINKISSSEDITKLDYFSTNIDVNLQIIKIQFNSPQSRDIIVHEFTLANPEKTKAFVIYIDGMINLTSFYNLMGSLMTPGNFQREMNSSFCDTAFEELIHAAEITKETKVINAVRLILEGLTCVFIDGCPYGIAVETKGFPKRDIQQPLTEAVVFGSQEGFTETIRTNLSLIRRYLKNKNLVAEPVYLGERSNTLCLIIYIKNLANPMLIEEVKRRMTSLKIDYLYSIGALEQLIEDHPLGIVPQTLITERPDRTSSFLVEGKVAILVDSSPHALVVPAISTNLIHVSEVDNLRWQYGFFIRAIRFTALLIALLLPAIYIGLINFHQEMIPTDLLIAIKKSREEVPFPSIVELLLMELSFEIIRESSIRVPGIMGTTVGIIGALILGQAAVAAKVVSPILVIIVAVTGLGSFAIPNYEMGFSVRILRFFFIIFAYMFGFYGISLGLFVFVGLISYMKSFGVPILSPVAPFTSSAFRDTLFRFPLWKQEKRVDFIQPLDKKTQPYITRKWAKESPKGRKE